MDLRRTRSGLRAAALALGFGVFACADDERTTVGAESSEANPATTDTAFEPRTLPDDGSGLVVRIVEPGAGAVAEPGKLLTVHYTGWLHDPAAADERGKKFDSSVDRGSPFQFPLGAGRVIQGWDRGVAGMQIGEKRELIIPPDLAYGERGAGGGLIPPNATLLFEVELLGVN